MLVTLCDEGECAEGVAADRLDGLFDVVDVVEGEQAEGEVAQGGHGAGAVAGPGLVVVFVPDGVAGPVFEVLDAPVSAGVGGDVGGVEGVLNGIQDPDGSGGMGHSVCRRILVACS